MSKKSAGQVQSPTNTNKTPADAPTEEPSSESLKSCITDLGQARALPATDGAAHLYADPKHAERSIVQFLDADGSLWRIVECDGALAKAPVLEAASEEE